MSAAAGLGVSSIVDVLGGLMDVKTRMRISFGSSLQSHSMAEYNVSSLFQPVPLPQASMLEFFPVFTRISELVQQYTTMDLDVLAPLLCH